ncbi:MAG: hypothetical protein ACM3OF_09315 [Gemmatimonas sp.]
MAVGKPHIVLTLDTKEPIELGAFVGAFTSLGNDDDRFIRQAEPDLAGEADLFVRRVRSGSIVVDLIPWLAMIAPFIDDREKALIIEKFVRVWKDRFEALLSGTGQAPETRPELKDWAHCHKTGRHRQDRSGNISSWKENDTCRIQVQVVGCT